MRPAGVEEEPRPPLAALGTYGSKVTIILENKSIGREQCISISENPPTAWSYSALSGSVELHSILVNAPTLAPTGVTLNLLKES